MRTSSMLVSLLFVFLNTSPLAAQEPGPPTDKITEETQRIQSNQTNQMIEILGKRRYNQDRELFLSGDHDPPDFLSFQTSRYKAQYEQARNMLIGGTVTTVLGLGLVALTLGITLSGENPCEDDPDCDQGGGGWLNMNELVGHTFMYSMAGISFVIGIVLLTVGSVRKDRAARLLNHLHLNRGLAWTF